jgi:hypothetical protein
MRSYGYRKEKSVEIEIKKGLRVSDHVDPRLTGMAMLILRAQKQVQPELLRGLHLQLPSNHHHWVQRYQHQRSDELHSNHWEL